MSSFKYYILNKIENNWIFKKLLRKNIIKKPEKPKKLNRFKQFKNYLYSVYLCNQYNINMISNILIGAMFGFTFYHYYMEWFNSFFTFYHYYMEWLSSFVNQREEYYGILDGSDTVSIFNDWREEGKPIVETSVSKSHLSIIGETLYENYGIIFLLGGINLLVAMIGVIYLIILNYPIRKLQSIIVQSNHKNNIYYNSNSIKEKKNLFFQSNLKWDNVELFYFKNKQQNYTYRK